MASQFERPEDGSRHRTAGPIGDMADDVRQRVEGASDLGKGYAPSAHDPVHDTADYVHADVERMDLDVPDDAGTHPLATFLVMGAIVVGTGILVAAVLRDTDRADVSDEGRLGLTSSGSSLGRRSSETLNRMRDAAFSFLLAKTVDAVDEIFPGFRDHYERA